MGDTTGGTVGDPEGSRGQVFLALWEDQPPSSTSRWSTAEKGDLPRPQHTYSEAQAKSHVGDGVDTPIHGAVAQVHQVSHDGHHGGIHHACGQSEQDAFCQQRPQAPP